MDYTFDSVTYQAVRSWGLSEITAWLQKNKLGQHSSAFVRNDIYGGALLHLDHGVLKEMGITNVGDRLRLISAIRLLHKQCAMNAAPNNSSMLTAESCMNYANAPLSYAPPIISSNTPLQRSATMSHPSTHPVRTASPLPLNGSLPPLGVMQSARVMSMVNPLAHPITPTQRAHTMEPPLSDLGSRSTTPSSSSSTNSRRPNTATGVTDAHDCPAPSILNAPRSPSSSHVRRPASALSTTNPTSTGYTVGRGAFGPKSRLGQISAPYNLRRPETESEERPPETTTDPMTGIPVKSLETIRRHIVKFLAEDGSSRSVDVSQCGRASDILSKVLHKFGLPTDPEFIRYMRHWVVAMTDADAQLKVLSEMELMTVCSQPHNYAPVWQHGLYLLRTTDNAPLRPGSQREVPNDSFRYALAKTKRASTFSILNGLGGNSIHGTEDSISPTRSTAYNRVKAATPDLTSSLPAVRRRVQNFFGQRPPSELISSHLSDFFPSTNSNDLHSCSDPSDSPGYDSRRPSPPVRLHPVSKLYPANKPDEDMKDLAKAMVTVDEITLDLERRESMHSPSFDSTSLSTVLEHPTTHVECKETTEIFTQPRMRWHRGALIGAGSFGKVFLGMNAKTGMLMAVKQVELPPSDDDCTRRWRMMVDSLESEIELLKSIHHPNIVQYLDSHSDGKFLNIFLEYVPGGSVVSLLRNYGAFEEPLVQNFVRQILLGLQFLHAGGILHRDIKGANILVDNKGGVKISDFGISKKVESGLLGPKSGKFPGLQGSVFWMAPEVVKQSMYTDKGDIWSLGCCVVEMFSGVHPWPRLDQMQALFQIGQNRAPPLPDDISPLATDFLRCAFNLDHTVRPSAEALLGHAFLLQPADTSEIEGSD